MLKCLCAVTATCRVDKFNVLTNDGAVFSVPRMGGKRSTMGCKTLLAMDCSADHAFALTLEQDTKIPAQVCWIPSFN